MAKSLNVALENWILFCLYYSVPLNAFPESWAQMYSHGSWVCIWRFLGAQLKTWGLTCVPSSRRRPGGIPLWIPLCPAGMSGKTETCKSWDRHPQGVDIQIQFSLRLFPYVCSGKPSSSHPAKINSVLAKHSSSTDEHQKQFQEEIKICSCRSGEGISLGQRVSLGVEEPCLAPCSCRFSLWLC